MYAVSFVAMDELEIREALALDQHFATAGFVVVSGRLGVILAVSGSAVRLGNFLRFPGQAAANGGAGGTQAAQGGMGGFGGGGGSFDMGSGGGGYDGGDAGDALSGAGATGGSSFLIASGGLISNTPGGSSQINGRVTISWTPPPKTVLDFTGGLQTYTVPSTALTRIPPGSCTPGTLLR